MKSARTLQKHISNVILQGTIGAQIVMYIARTLERYLPAVATEFPVVVLTGPRQSGKTTLLRHVFGNAASYVSLDVPDVRAVAIEDPRSFLEVFPPPAIFDEVQYVPGLLSYVRERVDADRSRAGQYILSGSQNLLLMEGATETLAGRAAVLNLLPLTLREAVGRPHAPLPWEDMPPRNAPVGPAFGELWRYIQRGTYPELCAAPDRDASRWYASYVQTYLERDVRSLRQIADLSQFQVFLRVLAARTAQVLDIADIARDTGISASTCRAWMTVLEATHQIVVVRPYFGSIGKRLVKRPRLYFLDTGTACYLCGLTTPEMAMFGPMAGALFETAVVAEAVKTLRHRGVEPRIYFWRTADGAEVDLIVEAEGTLIPIEAKATATPRPAMASGVRRFRASVGDRCAAGVVVHAGDTTLPLGGGVMAVPLGCALADG